MECLIVQWTQRIDSSLSRMDQHHCCIRTYWDQFQTLAYKNVIATQLPPPGSRG